MNGFAFVFKQHGFGVVGRGVAQQVCAHFVVSQAETLRVHRHHTAFQVFRDFIIQTCIRLGFLLLGGREFRRVFFLFGFFCFKLGRGRCLRYAGAFRLPELIFFGFGRGNFALECFVFNGIVHFLLGFIRFKVGVFRLPKICFRFNFRFSHHFQAKSFTHRFNASQFVQIVKIGGDFIHTFFLLILLNLAWTKFRQQYLGALAPHFGGCLGFMQTCLVWVVVSSKINRHVFRQHVQQLFRNRFQVTCVKYHYDRLARCLMNAGGGRITLRQNNALLILLKITNNCVRALFLSAVQEFFVAVFINGLHID